MTPWYNLGVDVPLSSLAREARRRGPFIRGGSSPRRVAHPANPWRGVGPFPAARRRKTIGLVPIPSRAIMVVKDVNDGSYPPSGEVPGDALSRTETPGDDHKNEDMSELRSCSSETHKDNESGIGHEQQVAAAERLGMIMRDTSLDQRLDALKAVLVFLTPGEVKIFLEVVIAQHERSEFRGVQVEVLQGPVAQVASDNASSRLQGLAALRSLVCKLENAQFEAEALLEAGLLPKVIDLLGDTDNPDVQVEAAWILCNVFSGPSRHTQYLVDHHAVPALLPLLCSTSTAVKDQALWALGNCAGDSPAMRDTVLLYGLLGPLLDNLQPDADVSTLRVSCWALCNLVVRKGLGDLYQPGKLPWSESELTRMLEAMGWVLRHVSDKEALCDTCWALRSMLTLPIRSGLAALMASCGVTEGLFRLMGTHSSSSTRRHAELTMTKILASDEHGLLYSKARDGSKAVSICADKALQLFLIKLKHRMPRVRLYSCRALAILVRRAQQHDWQQQHPSTGSRACGCSSPALPSIVATLMGLLEEEQEEEEVQLEALWALRSALLVGLGKNSSSRPPSLDSCPDSQPVSRFDEPASLADDDSSSSGDGDNDSQASGGDESVVVEHPPDEEREDHLQPLSSEQQLDVDALHAQGLLQTRHSVLTAALLHGYKHETHAQRPLLPSLLRVLVNLLQPPASMGAASQHTHSPGPAAVLLALECLQVLLPLAATAAGASNNKRQTEDLQRALATHALPVLDSLKPQPHGSAVAALVQRVASRALADAFPSS